MAGDKPFVASIGIRDLPPDSVRFLAEGERGKLDELLSPPPNQAKKAVPTPTLMGLGLANTLPAESVLADTKPASELLNSEDAVPKVYKIPITNKELEGEIDKNPINAAQELWGKKLRFPFITNIILPGRVGLISPYEMACVFYGEGKKNFRWLSFKDLKNYNPELLANYPFKT